MSESKETKKTSTKAKKTDVLEELDSSTLEEEKGQKSKGNVSSSAKVHEPVVKTEQNNEEPEEIEEEKVSPVVGKKSAFPETRSQEDIGITYQKDKHNMKAVLDKQPKVAFLIPKQPGDSDDAYDTVQINGFRIEIKRGTMVNIPMQVAELLADKYRIQSEAGNAFKVDRSEKVQNALS